MTWPLTSRLSSATYGGPGDGWALIWQTRYRLEDGLTYFSPTYVPDVGWPVGGVLTSSLMLSNAVVELPNAALLVLGIGDVTAYNLIVLAAALTSSLAMYGVLRRLGCRPAVAFWGGLVYLLAPWHLEKLSIHPTLASMAALPLLILGVVEWTARPGWRSGALVVGATALATYTHSYYAIGAALLLAAAVPLVLVVASRRGALREALVNTAFLAGLLLLVPIPLAAAVGLQSSEISLLLDRPLYLIDLAARPRLWLLPSADNPVFGGASRHYLQSHGYPLNEGERALYVGFVTLALAVIGVVAALRDRRRRLAVAVAGLTAFVGALFSSPELVRFPGLNHTIRMPIAYLNDVLSFISTPARFFALTLTGLVVLGALGLQRLTERIAPGWALAVVAMACVGSALELPLRRDNLVVSTEPTPLVRALERDIPEGKPIASYPSIENFYLPIARQLFYQVAHRHPMLNGAPATSLEDSVRVAVADPSDPATPRRLALLGFEYATYDMGQAVEAAALIGRPVEEAVGYRPPKGFDVLERLNDGSLIMGIRARPAAALVSIGTGFTRVGRWMSDEDGTLLACSTAAGRYTLRFKAGAFAQERWFRIADGIPIQVKPPGERLIRTRVTLRRGWQLLPLQLIGSKPTRPSDVIPGEPDSRPLAISIGPIGVAGPRGPAGVCAQPTRLSKLNSGA